MVSNRRNKTASWILSAVMGAFCCSCVQDDPADAADAELTGNGQAIEVSGEVADEDVEAQQVSALIGASIERVFLDAEAQRLLDVADSLKRDPQNCYSREEISDDEYRYDFDDCDNTDGIMIVEKLESGVVVATFQSTFSINQVGIVGSLAFDGQGRLSYQIYHCDGEGQPGTPLVVTDLVDDVASDVTVDGRAAVTIIDAELAVWGVGTSDDGTTRSNFSLGSSSSTATSTQPATALTWDLPRRDCDCPGDGIIWYERSRLLVDGVTVDLDDFERNPDGEDDYPEYNVPINLTVAGALTLDVTGCGYFEADFDADIDVSVDLERPDLVTGLQAACGQNLLSDDACDRIESFLNKDRNANIEINVSIPDTRLDDLAHSRLEARFDRSICGS